MLKKNKTSKSYPALAIILYSTFAYSSVAYAIQGSLSLSVGPGWNQGETTTLPNRAGTTLQQISVVTSWNLFPAIAASGHLNFGDYISTNLIVNGGFVRFGRAETRTAFVADDLSVEIDNSVQFFSNSVGVKAEIVTKIPITSPISVELYAGYAVGVASQSFESMRSPSPLLPKFLFTKSKNKGPYIGIDLETTINAVEISTSYELLISKIRIFLTESGDDELVIFKVPTLGNSFSLKATHTVNESWKISGKISYDHLKNRRLGTTTSFDGDVFQAELENFSRLLDQTVAVTLTVIYEF